MSFEVGGTQIERTVIWQETIWPSSVRPTALVNSLLRKTEFFKLEIHVMDVFKNYIHLAILGYEMGGVPIFKKVKKDCIFECFSI